MPTIRTANRRAKTRKLRAARRWLRTVAKALAVALDCPDRPWFQLSLGKKL